VRIIAQFTTRKERIKERKNAATKRAEIKYPDESCKTRKINEAAKKRIVKIDNTLKSRLLTNIIQKAAGRNTNAVTPRTSVMLVSIDDGS